MIFVLISLLLCNECILAKINMTEYYGMPKLFIYDEFDRCLTEHDENAVYCIVDTVIKPNNSATIWPIIEKYTNDTKRHFRHDRVQRGICMNRCEKLIGRLTKVVQQTYYLHKFNYSAKVSF